MSSIQSRVGRFASAFACASTIALLCACSPVRLVNALTPRHDYIEHAGVQYESGERHALDVYVPKSASASASARPLVVFFYGGSWQSGERRDYRFVGEALASRGYVTVIPDYWLYPQTTFPGFMDDAAAAVAWARAHAADFGADPDRLFLMGHSAGAHIAMLLATDRHYLMEHGVEACSIAGAIGLAGPYDFLPLQDDDLKAVFPATLRQDSQPINHVAGREPPIFLGVGTADRTIDPGNTDRFAARLLAAHDRVLLKRYDGINHAMIVGSLARPVRALSTFITVAPVLDDVSGFIDRHTAH
ncbi:Esterase/lipase/thioesterase family protein [Candidatus Burkholderia verschuerenii]|uniref:Esterase/lipase/thioesterase family protein n=1 Tax=Candidatus Burkholderia verschuerenii TaxID=242163 RepID=A0A0L0MAG2_9BURK|nr:alpha/beta hydrolase [Candidatus Burkholderia verschuerenii]KND59692.1 Esterase/lipase/thioesterase family protein [Candidatus Burkholderia verschuerenii]